MKTQWNLFRYGILLSLIIGCNKVLAENESDPPTGGGNGPIFKSPRINPVSVTQEINCLIVSFTQNVGAVTVAVENEADDTVYDTTATAVAGTSLTIDTTGWESGTYTITVTSSAGVIYTTIVDIL